MSGRNRKAVVAVSAALASLGAVRMAAAQSTSITIGSGQSAVVDGWNITAGPSGVSLLVTSDDNNVYIDKSASFTSVGQEIPITFQPEAGAVGTIDFIGEELQNNTGSAFNGFEFDILKSGSGTADFTTVSNTFTPPDGYTGVTLSADGEKLIYSGSQASGTTSNWGDNAPDFKDNLIIAADTGFTLKEISSGGGSGPSPVPVPAAAWQSLFSLGGLGLIGLFRWNKRRKLA